MKDWNEEDFSDVFEDSEDDGSVYYGTKSAYTLELRYHLSYIIPKDLNSPFEVKCIFSKSPASHTLSDYGSITDKFDKYGTGESYLSLMIGRGMLLLSGIPEGVSD